MVCGLYRAYDEVRWFASRVGADLLVGFDKEWTSPEGFADINAVYQKWWRGIFHFPLDLPGTPFRRSMAAKDELDAVSLIRLIDNSWILLQLLFELKE
jgi:hypothetical protein